MLLALSSYSEDSGLKKKGVNKIFSNLCGISEAPGDFFICCLFFLIHFSRMLKRCFAVKLQKCFAELHLTFQGQEEEQIITESSFLGELIF